MKIETLQQLLAAQDRYRHFTDWIRGIVTPQTVWQWRKGTQHPNKRILKNVLEAVNKGIEAEERDITGTEDADASDAVTGKGDQ